MPPHAHGPEKNAPGFRRGHSLWRAWEATHERHATDADPYPLEAEPASLCEVPAKMSGTGN